MSASRVSATVVALVSVFAVSPAFASADGVESRMVAPSAARVPGLLGTKRVVAQGASLAGALVTRSRGSG